MIRLVACQFAEHAPAILQLFNHSIQHSTALYEYQPRTLATIEQWFATKAAGRFPIIGAINEQGELAGFASYGAFRPQPAYKYTVEHSVYVRTDQQGRGVGKLLMHALIEAAERQDYHVMVGVIDASNTASIRLHTQLGFSQAGIISQSGFKFGKWLDAAFYQRILTTPTEPQEG